MADKEVVYLFNHVFLPSQVPQSDDRVTGAGNQALVERLIKYCHQYYKLSDAQYYRHWSTLLLTLTTFRTLHGNQGLLSKKILQNAFKAITYGGVLILHIATQNSGLIIEKTPTNDYIIESFEASPAAAKVLAAQTALQWDFPSRSVVITATTFEDAAFQDSLADFLEKASIESLKQFSATTHKAGSYASESRDTPSPAVIGQLLMALLEANGGRHKATRLTRKRIHDEVCWSDGAQNPWRRSATWLVLRVGLQRSLCFLLGDNLGTIHYKFFMSFVMSQFCIEFCSHLPADQLAFARTKLSRRIAKLRCQIESPTQEIAFAHKSLFARYENGFRTALDTANQRLDEDWRLIQTQATKRVLPLLRYVDKTDTTLSLSRSRKILQAILEEKFHGRPSSQLFLESRRNNVAQYSKWNESSAGTFDDYLKLVEIEAALKLDVANPVESELDSSLNHTCVQLMGKIRQYRDVACSLYKSDPEQLSLMVLLVMELWKALDSAAVQLYPLLSQYDPGFPEDLFFVLQIARLADLQRVQEMEYYLQNRRRRAESTFPSIFDEISSRSFAVQYFNQCQDMQRLLAKIMSADQVAKTNKQEEWERLSSEYDAKMKQAREMGCECPEYEQDSLRRRYDRNQCRKHELERHCERMRIKIHEAILPQRALQAQAVVFELLIPQGFAAWRDSTWQVLQMARQEPMANDGSKPKMLLHDYAGFKGYGVSTKRTLLLASFKKSFYDTHYSHVRFPTPLDQVCLPHGLEYHLFDNEKSLWPSRYSNKPSFSTLCAPSLPANSVFASLESYVHPDFKGKALDANEIIANQTKCPNTLPMPEFLAFQDLRLGCRTRWINLLRELASPNLNFGTDEACILVTQLAFMTGPIDGCLEGRSPLRATHWVFQDQEFCTELASQIRRRLENIAANWREGQTVNCLIILLQRMISLASSPESVREAQSLILSVRDITHKWTRLLQREILSDANMSKRRSRDTLLAALLCRKTFMIEAEKVTDLLPADSLALFLECSITVKDNIPSKELGYIAKLPLFIKKLFIYNLKLTCRLETKIRLSISSSAAGVTQAVNSIWVEADGEASRQFTPWTFLEAPHDGWITARSIGVDDMLEQDIHLDIFEGTLLIDNQPLGRLPDAYTKEGFFQQFFGGRVCPTRPSNLPGMTYMLAGIMEGHQVHFGFRNGIHFMRARSEGVTLEFIPDSVFLTGNRNEPPDLPLPLIHGHVHWLNLQSHSIEIRPRATMWRSKASDWRIDLHTYQATRRASLLVRPGSSAFDRIAEIIEPFEHRNRMVIHQARGGLIYLRLPALELTFKVNRDGLLESGQLQAVIDSNQDAGTLYGLDSKLVLSDVRIPENRSVIVAMGPAEIKPYMKHVRIHINHTGFYARFPINDLLGRLECAAETRLVYFKAYCHAITGFVRPDPLTKRTGTNEALHCLCAGDAQPCAPLDEESYRILSSIADLTPRRVYYPEDIKVLQKVTWAKTLSSAIQHDDFSQIVQDILQQCTVLHRFHLTSKKPPANNHRGDIHLLTRAQNRNQVYRPLAFPVATSAKPSNTIYIARDCTTSRNTSNAFEAALLVNQWSSHIAVSQNLASILQGWPSIQGYVHEFNPNLLSSLIDINLSANWGSLFRYCQESSGIREKYKLMFLFATISFNEEIDMAVIRSLIAISIMAEFKNIAVPPWPSFIHFRYDQIPTLSFLKQIMNSHRTPYGDGERPLLPIKLQGKQRRKLEQAQKEHEKLSEDSCDELAAHFLRQWPCHELSLNECNELPLIDCEKAYASILPEWQRLVENYELSRHLDKVQTLLNSCKPTLLDVISPSRAKQKHFPTLYTSSIRPRIHDLLSKISKQSEDHTFLNNDYSKVTLNPLIVDPNLSTAPNQSFATAQDASRCYTQKSTTSTAIIRELRGIISRFSRSNDGVRRSYGEDLENSICALERKSNKASQDVITTNPSDLVSNLPVMISTSRTALNNRFAAIRAAALTQDTYWLEAGSLLPDITPVTILEMLRTLKSYTQLTISRDIIIIYGVLIKNLQHLLRIKSALQAKDTVWLASETQHFDHPGWHAADHVDWLLLEIDFNIAIRPDQREVAEAMISPKNGANSVLQMNMGRGKSSVIIPMIVTEIADAHLARVVVPKSLLLQMAQLLQARLGGLIGRKVKIIPFSRKTPTEIETSELYHDIHKEMFRNQGVILTMPEYLLSFHLSGLQQLSNGRFEQAACMMKLKTWLTSKCRDILDESDHMLAVKTQLIYPSGTQSLVDGHPNRWNVVQTILRMVKKHLEQLRREFPRNIEVIQRSPGAFPTIYLLNDEVQNALTHRLIDSVLKGEGAMILISTCTQEEADLTSDFLRNAQFSKSVAMKVAGVFRDNLDVRQHLLLLRGLLVHRILIMGLNKRWNVQYGLHPGRDPIAVPFSSKGTPSEQAEFGHPDVAILLTCLSFYYSGLTLAQFQQSFNLLLKSDEPIEAFGLWIQDAKSFPDSLRSWQSINVDDEVQCKQLWEHLRQQMTVINYFLNHFVFPRHARTFSTKIISSGWDIPSPLPDAFRASSAESSTPGAKSGKSKSLTVGFSGTNDNKTLLPLNIRQNDLPGLSHTNAEVLTYLLQPRNGRYFPALDFHGKRLTERAFLYKLKDYRIRILLDAGAQVLELNNRDLAQTWLLVDTEPEAAVYFDEDNRARVLHRDGKSQPLAASPYHDNLGKCVVYLDEAHTRGVDLKMPADAVAALTLGINQSKDHTVQGKSMQVIIAMI